MNKEISFTIGGIVVGVIVTLLFSSGGQSGLMMWRGNNSNNSTSGRTVGMMNQIDQHFIEQMVPHHDGAIAMANLALTKDTHPEIKTLATAIIKSQSKEITEMEGWYKSWFGGDIRVGNTYSMMGGMMSSGGMHMGGDEDMTILENAVDFDKAFIEAMIPHHQLAIMMAQMLKSGTTRPEMLTLANNIIKSQSSEIEQMQGWYETWYK